MVDKSLNIKNVTSRTRKSRKITLRDLKRQISEYYYNEAKIMDDMLEANLSKEEIKELQEFMLNHPFSKLCQLIQELKAQKESAKGNELISTPTRDET